MTKNVMIVASTELEPVIVHRLSETGKVQFREVPPSVVGGYEGLFRHTYDYDELKNSLEEKINTLTENISEIDENLEPDKETIKQFTYNPEKTLKDTTEYLNNLANQFDQIKEPLDKVKTSRDSEIRSKRQEFSTEDTELVQKITQTKAKVTQLEALDPALVQQSVKVGVVKAENKDLLEEYLQGNGISTEFKSISEDEAIVYVLGKENMLEQVNSLFTVYEVKDINTVFDSDELSLMRDEKKLKEAIEKYNKKTAELEEKEGAAQVKNDRTVSKITDKYQKDLESAEKKYSEAYSKLLEESQSKIKGASFIVDYLTNYSDIPAQRNPVVSILYTWVEDNDVSEITSTLEELKGEDDLLYKIGDVSGKELKAAKREK